ncbi:MAG: hypothetical protein WCT77_06515, partial [Bacteroidota bacterium]
MKKNFILIFGFFCFFSSLANCRMTDDSEVFIKVFKQSFIENDSTTKKEIINFPVPVFKRLEKKQELKECDLSSALKNFFDKKFVQKLKKIKKLEKSKLSMQDYKRFNLNTFGMIYEIK